MLKLLFGIYEWLIKKAFGEGPIGYIVKYVFKVSVGVFTGPFKLIVTFFKVKGVKKLWIFSVIPLFLIVKWVAFNFFSDEGNSFMFMVFGIYYIVWGFPLKLMKGESIIPVFMGNLKDIFKVNEEDKPYYEWLSKNRENLEKLKKSIFEIFRLNNLLIKGNTEEETKYITLSGKPKIIDLKSDEIELRYILPNGLPFTKVDNENVKQAILQVFQKYFSNIGKIEFSIKGDVMTIKSIRSSGSADFSKTYKFPNLMKFSYSPTFTNPLEFQIGVDEDGNFKKYDLGSMPHLLVASETGGGKSSAITNILVSLMKNKIEGAPIDFFIIDPKKVEFAGYRHLKGFTVETNFDKALSLISAMCDEMDKRYDILMEKGVKELKTLHKRKENLEIKYNVLIIDEFADIMTDPKIKNDFEMYIKRLTALGRACGIHLILATQNPTAEVVTGLIKAKIPGRIGLKASDQVKSRIIIDSPELSLIKEKGEAYVKTGSGLEHIKNFFIDEETLNKFIHNFGIENEILYDLLKENFGEEENQTLKIKDKFDLLFEKMKNLKTFKISWFKEIDGFTENNFRGLSKILQEKNIIQKLDGNRIILVDQNLLNNELKKELEKIL